MLHRGSRDVPICQPPPSVGVHCNMLRLAPSTYLCARAASCDILPKGDIYCRLSSNHKWNRRDEEEEEDNCNNEMELKHYKVCVPSFSPTEDEECLENFDDESARQPIECDAQSRKINGLSSSSILEPITIKEEQKSAEYSGAVQNSLGGGADYKPIVKRVPLTPSLPPQSNRKKKSVKRRRLHTSVTIELTSCRYSVMRRLAKTLNYRVIDEFVTASAETDKEKIDGESVSSAVSTLPTVATQQPLVSTNVSNFNILWADTVISYAKLSQFANWQRFNHIPGMDILTKKFQLANTMGKMKKVLPELFAFVPNSWSLRTEKQSFSKYMACHGNSQENIGTTDAGQIINRGTQSGTTQSVNSRSKFFIMKPNSGSQGKGIIITKDPLGEGAYVDLDNYIVQEYISRPLLIDERKFDLRVYVLVTSMFPIPSIFIYEDGLVRICTKRYERPTESNTRDACAHLTNYAVNKKSDNFVFCRDPEGKGDSGNKRSFGWFNLWLDEELEDEDLKKMHQFTGRNGAKIRRLKLHDSEKKRNIKDESPGDNSEEKSQKCENRTHESQNLQSVEHEQMTHKPSSTPPQCSEPSRSAKLWYSIDHIVVKTLLAAQPHVAHKYKNIFPSQGLSVSSMFDTPTLDGKAGDYHSSQSSTLPQVSDQPPSITSVMGNMQHNEAGFTCFEILGFDIMIDEKLRPWLLEVNHTPSFATDTPLDRRIKEGLLLETFQILNCHPKDKFRSVERDKWYTNRRILNNEKVINGGISNSIKPASRKRIISLGHLFSDRDVCATDQPSNLPAPPSPWSLKDHLIGESKRCRGFRRIYPMGLDLPNQHQSFLTVPGCQSLQCNDRQRKGVSLKAKERNTIAAEVQFLNDINRIERQITFDDINEAAKNNFMQPLSITSNQETRAQEARSQRAMREAGQKIHLVKCSSKGPMSFPRKNLPPHPNNHRSGLQKVIM
eukprot:Tbor_TRINITY_DN6043_c2_g3::TRINITY_DN6043_c2_g3_i1::g.11019::m.11019/K16582/TTLL6_13; tubulin polyglutamylase TTLL6/13